MVEIGTEQREQRVVIWVRDDGPGLPSEVAGSIFEQYQSFAGDKSATTSMGWGRYVVRRLAELKGGSVAATSDNGHTKFVVDLPAAEAPAPAVADY